MTKKTKLQQLGRAALEALAAKALTDQERNRQASAKQRQAKKQSGLQQISVWLPRGSAAIDTFKKAAEELCERHLAEREAQEVSPKNSNDLQGQNQARETHVNPPENTARDQGV
jgi:hypothetical protein